MNVETLDGVQLEQLERDSFGRHATRAGRGEDGGRAVYATLYSGRPAIVAAGTPAGAQYPDVLRVAVEVDDEVQLWPDIGELLDALRWAGGGLWTQQLGLILELGDAEPAPVELVKVGELALQPVEHRGQGLEVVS